MSHLETYCTSVTCGGTSHPLNPLETYIVAFLIGFFSLQVFVLDLPAVIALFSLTWFYVLAMENDVSICIC